MCLGALGLGTPCCGSSGVRGLNTVCFTNICSSLLYFVLCVCVTVDGLDSAGCSPKDDEDDDSDDEVSENCAAAAMKQNKISPASGYHSGSAYRYQVGKEKTWLAKFDERQHMAVPSENNSARLEPADDSYCSRYQRRSSEDSTAAGRAFSANSDAVMQRICLLYTSPRPRD